MDNTTRATESNEERNRFRERMKEREFQREQEMIKNVLHALTKIGKTPSKDAEKIIEKFAQDTREATIKDLNEQKEWNTASKETKENQIAEEFVNARKWVIRLIVGIFILADLRIGLAIVQSFYTTFEVAQNIKAIKYSVLFLTFQFFIFSQGFGFSSIVKLVEAISSAINNTKPQNNKED